MEDVSETRIQIAELRIFPKGPGAADGQTGRMETGQKFSGAAQQSYITTNQKLEPDQSVCCPSLRSKSLVLRETKEKPRFCRTELLKNNGIALSCHKEESLEYHKRIYFCHPLRDFDREKAALPLMEMVLPNFDRLTRQLTASAVNVAHILPR